MCAGNTLRVSRIPSSLIPSVRWHPNPLIFHWAPSHSLPPSLFLLGRTVAATARFLSLSHSVGPQQHPLGSAACLFLLQNDKRTTWRQKLKEAIRCRCSSVIHARKESKRPAADLCLSGLSLSARTKEKKSQSPLNPHGGSLTFLLILRKKELVLVLSFSLLPPSTLRLL